MKGLIFSSFQPTIPATTKNLADRLTLDAIRNPRKLICATPTEMVQTLYGNDMKPQL